LIHHTLKTKDHPCGEDTDGEMHVEIGPVAHIGNRRASPSRFLGRPLGRTVNLSSNSILPAP
jgi:hypothetical protein